MLRTQTHSLSVPIEANHQIHKILQQFLEEYHQGLGNQEKLLNVSRKYPVISKLIASNLKMTEHVKLVFSAILVYIANALSPDDKNLRHFLKLVDKILGGLQQYEKEYDANKEYDHYYFLILQLTHIICVHIADDNLKQEFDITTLVLKSRDAIQYILDNNKDYLSSDLRHTASYYYLKSHYFYSLIKLNKDQPSELLNREKFILLCQNQNKERDPDLDLITCKTYLLELYQANCHYFHLRKLKQDYTLFNIEDYRPTLVLLNNDQFIAFLNQSEGKWKKHTYNCIYGINIGTNLYNELVIETSCFISTLSDQIDLYRCEYDIDNDDYPTNTHEIDRLEKMLLFQIELLELACKVYITEIFKRCSSLLKIDFNLDVHRAEIESSKLALTKLNHIKNRHDCNLNHSENALGLDDLKKRKSLVVYGAFHNVFFLKKFEQQYLPSIIDYYHDSTILSRPERVQKEHDALLAILKKENRINPHIRIIIRSIIDYLSGSNDKSPSLTASILIHLPAIFSENVHYVTGKDTSFDYEKYFLFYVSMLVTFLERMQINPILSNKVVLDSLRKIRHHYTDDDSNFSLLVDYMTLKSLYLYPIKFFQSEISTSQESKDSVCTDINKILNLSSYEQQFKLITQKYSKHDGSNNILLQCFKFLLQINHHVVYSIQSLVDSSYQDPNTIDDLLLSINNDNFFLLLSQLAQPSLLQNNCIISHLNIGHHLFFELAYTTAILIIRQHTLIEEKLSVLKPTEIVNNPDDFSWDVLKITLNRRLSLFKFAEKFIKTDFYNMMSTTVFVNSDTRPFSRLTTLSSSFKHLSESTDQLLSKMAVAQSSASVKQAVNKTKNRPKQKKIQAQPQLQVNKKSVGAEHPPEQHSYKAAYILRNGFIPHARYTYSSNQSETSTSSSSTISSEPNEVKINVKSEILHEPTHQPHINIELDIPSSLLTILNILHSQGYTAYLVGGYPRDSLLGIPPNDADIVTTASMKQIQNLFKDHGEMVGSRFPVYHIKNENLPIQIRPLTSKTDRSNAELIQDNNMTFIFYLTTNLNDDAMHRDFTCNALYYNHVEKRLYNPVGGYEDLLTHKTLCIIDPASDLNLIINPIRVLKIIRYAIRCNLTIPNHIEELIKLHCANLEKVDRTLLSHELHTISSLLGQNLLSHLLARFGIPNTIYERVFSSTPDWNNHHSTLYKNSITFFTPYPVFTNTTSSSSSIPLKLTASSELINNQ